MSFVLRELSFVHGSERENLLTDALSLALVPSALVRSSNNCTWLLGKFRFTLSMPHAFFKIANILGAMAVIASTFPMENSIEPLPFVGTSELVGHFTLASQRSSHNAAVVNIAATESLFTEAMGLISFPLAFIAVTIAVGHRALTLLFVLLEPALVDVTVCLRLPTVAILLVPLYLALVDLTLLRHRLGEAILFAILPKAADDLARAQHLHALLTELAFVELSMAKSTIHEYQEALSVWLPALCHLSSEEDSL